MPWGVPYAVHDEKAVAPVSSYATADGAVWTAWVRTLWAYSDLASRVVVGRTSPTVTKPAVGPSDTPHGTGYGTLALRCLSALGRSALWRCVGVRWGGERGRAPSMVGCIAGEILSL